MKHFANIETAKLESHLRSGDFQNFPYIHSGTPSSDRRNSWNSLPPVTRLADSMDSFKEQLKTHLLTKAYPMQLFVRLFGSDMAALLRHISCRNYYAIQGIAIFNIKLLKMSIFHAVNILFATKLHGS